MGNFKIGVMNDSFRLPLRDGLRTAAAIGAQGVQMYAVDGELSPKQVTPTLLKFLPYVVI